jgi:hypothetical protein
MRALKITVLVSLLFCSPLFAEKITTVSGSWIHLTSEPAFISPVERSGIVAMSVGEPSGKCGRFSPHMIAKGSALPVGSGEWWGCFPNGKSYSFCVNKQSEANATCD